MARVEDQSFDIRLSSIVRKDLPVLVLNRVGNMNQANPALGECIRRCACGAQHCVSFPAHAISRSEECLCSRGRVCKELKLSLANTLSRVRRHADAIAMPSLVSFGRFVGGPVPEAVVVVDDNPPR